MDKRGSWHQSGTISTCFFSLLAAFWLSATSVSPKLTDLRPPAQAPPSDWQKPLILRSGAQGIMLKPSPASRLLRERCYRQENKGVATGLQSTFSLHVPRRQRGLLSGPKSRRCSDGAGGRLAPWREEVLALFHSEWPLRVSSLPPPASLRRASLGISLISEDSPAHCTRACVHTHTHAHTHAPPCFTAHISSSSSGFPAASCTVTFMIADDSHSNKL